MSDHGHYALNQTTNYIQEVVSNGPFTSEKNIVSHLRSREMGYAKRG